MKHIVNLPVINQDLIGDLSATGFRCYSENTKLFCISQDGIGEEVLKMSTEEIVQRTRLLDSEIKVSDCNANHKK